MPSWGEQWSCSENNAIFTQNIEHNLRSPTLEQLQSDSGTQQQGRNSGKMSYLVTRLRLNTADNRTRNEWRILRVLLVAVPTCNRSLINHNRRIWQIKRIRSCRNIFHGDHQIHLSQLLETQHFTAKMSPFWSYWHLCKANSVCGAITSCKIQF